jgi:hypothetical protein
MSRRDYISARLGFERESHALDDMALSCSAQDYGRAELARRLEGERGRYGAYDLGRGYKMRTTISRIAIAKQMSMNGWRSAPVALHQEADRPLLLLV